MKKNSQKKPVDLPVKFGRAKPLTKKTIEALNGERPIEDTIIMPKKSKFELSQYSKTFGDDIWGWFESQPWGKWLVLGLGVLFVVAVAYWGIKQ